MQFKSGLVVQFVSGFCALFAVAGAVVVFRREKTGTRGEKRREKQKERKSGKSLRKKLRMESYKRIDKPKEETKINDNEIRITAQGRMRNYITYATTLFMEKGSDEIVLKAMGRAINKTVMIAELIKRRIVGLHQSTSIGSIDITDTWKPLEDDLQPVETTRHVSMITITLSRKNLNTSNIGYQPPLPEDQVKKADDFDNGRDVESGDGGLDGSVSHFWNDYVEEEYNGGERGRGRGRGRNRYTRGRGRGFGQTPAPEYYVSGEAEPPLAQGSGRGGGRAKRRGGARGNGRPAHAKAA